MRSHKKPKVKLNLQPITMLMNQKDAVLLRKILSHLPRVKTPKKQLKSLKKITAQVQDESKKVATIPISKHLSELKAQDNSNPTQALLATKAPGLKT